MGDTFILPRPIAGPVLSYPLRLRFKLLALSSKIRATDAQDRMVLYAAQKMLRLKEEIQVYRDDSKREVLYRIKADRVMDFRARYAITGPDGTVYGAVRRQGARSIWKATYDIEDASGQVVGVLHEEDPWLKLLDAIIGGIPFLNMLINPAYLVDVGNRTVLYLKKEPAFFEGKFRLEAREKVEEEQERLLLPAVVVAMILERQRG